MISNAGNLLRTSLLVSLLAGLLLTASGPARADSISSERALLDRVDESPGTASAPKSFASVLADDQIPFIDGERALLNDRPLVDTRPRPRDAAGAASSGAAFPDEADPLLHHAAP
jgi:hypothetical protein